MLQITVERIHSTPDCTIGRLTIGDFTCYTVERPWLDNKPKVSCIPPGKYKFAPHNWKSLPVFKFSKCWQILDVPNRTAILIHAGNTSKDVIGCIAVGSERGMIDGHEGVVNSRATLKKLQEIIGERGGEIIIV